MFAATAARIDADDPLSGLELGERPEPTAPDGWTTVTVKAAALNHHDVWTLRGVGISADRLPIVLGCDAAGIDADGNEVVVHAVIADPDAGGGDETLDPRRSLLSERYDGAFAERVCVPRRNLVPKPSALSFEEAACLPTAYLTAYKMLFEKSGVQPGATLLVQGAGGGVATAIIVLGRAAGYRVWATSRSEAKRERALKLGADQVFPAGARLPERVDVVMETVGQATWAHSVRSLKPGGRIVISGATSGDASPAELTRVFFTQLSVTGSTMGSRDQLGRLARFCEQTGARPVIDRVLPLAQARDGFQAMITGDLFGKIVFTLVAAPGGEATRPAARGPARRRCAGPSVLLGGVLGLVRGRFGLVSGVLRGLSGRAAPSRRVVAGTEDLGLDALQRVFEDRAQVADHVLAGRRGLRGQPPQVGGELHGQPLQVAQRPEVERSGPAGHVAPAPHARPVFPAAPPGPVGPAGSLAPCRPFVPARLVPVLLTGVEPGAGGLAEPAGPQGLVTGALGFLAEPPGLLVHPPGGLGAASRAAEVLAALFPRRALPRGPAALARGPAPWPA